MEFVIGARYTWHSIVQAYEHASIPWYTLVMQHPKVVSVFGSSSPAEGTDAYGKAQQLGELLAQAGFSVATGGYQGVMEAVSRGASDAGGHVIGVTSDRIEQYSPSSSANKWVAEEIRYPSLRERLYHLVSSCDAAIALSGGIGTLSEVALAWSLIQTGEIAPKPLVLVGRPWQSIMHTFMKYSEGHVQKEHQELLTLLDEETAAVGYLGQAIGDG